MWRQLAVACALGIQAVCGTAQPPVTREEPAGKARRELAPGQDLRADTSHEKTPAFLPENGPSERDYADLHNLMQITDHLYVGAEPKTEAAFQQLTTLGVKAIVSVDGARPNLERAADYGIRYVHVPIGYDGISPRAARLFARAADELKVTTYVHCHHGNHRGPAAAAAICVARGTIDGKGALEILKRAGTSTSYAGLWRDVKRYRRPAPGDAIPELVSVAEVGSLAAAMATIDRAADNLQLCQAQDWRTPPDHPDVSPPHEALLLREGFREIVRQLEVSDDSNDEFLALMKEAEATAAQLEAVLATGNTAAVASIVKNIQIQCKQCHHDYRN